jgi:hypothetical protein
MTLTLRINHQFYYYKSRTNQRSGDHNARTIDQRSEIDRRNQRILYPLNAKDTYGSEKNPATFHYQKGKFSSSSFNLESYNSYCTNHRSIQRISDENLLDHSSIYFQPSHDKRTIGNSNSTFIYGNSIIKTNKAAILSILEQQLNNGDNSNNYTNKYGVIINGDGPFWPHDYRILHPTPKLLSRELTPKEFYFTVLLSKLNTS